MLKEILVEGEICVEGDLIYKGFEPYKISSMFTLGREKELYVLASRQTSFGIHYIPVAQLSLSPQELKKKVRVTAQPPSFESEVRTKPKTKFHKLPDKALMVLVKKKNKEAIQEFKNRKIKR